MKRQIRRGTFETNSSSTHSLTMCMKSDYDKWINGEVLLFAGFNCIYPDGQKPQENHFYTKEEAVAFEKSSKYAPKDFNWNDEEGVRKLLRFHEWRDNEYKNDSVDWFEDTFITPSGEEVIAFGECGYYG